MKLLSSNMSRFGLFLHLYSIIFICFGLSTGVATSGILMNETDRLALLAFKDMISQDPLQVMSSWNDSLHFCEWTGVVCSRRHQRVVMLNLQSQGLVGTLSPCIGNLSFLRNISLLNNSFHGEIPQEVGHLFRLQEFQMSNNSFVGEIPVTLSNCSNLEVLSLTNNKLIGNIPIGLGSMSKLTFLSFGKNNITGGVPPFFGNLSFLNYLILGDNSLEGSIPDFMGKMKSLEYVDLSVNILSGMIPPSLYNLSSLKYFSVVDNQLIGSLPLEIGLKLPNLIWFYIGGNHFFGSIPISLFNASRLERISINDNKFTGLFPIEVGNLKGLTVLSLNLNHLGNGKAGDLNFLNYLTNATNLQWVNIATNHFGGKLPNSIANLSNQMYKLYLGGNEISGSIPYGIGNLVNLIVLGLDINFLTGRIPSGMGMLQKLQGLYLDRNRFSGQIPSSLGNISHLYDLDLSYNILEGNIISDFGKCHFLQILDLSKNKFNGTIPKKIIGLSSQLTFIRLAHNSLSGPLPSEVGYMKNLRMLDVSENKMAGEIPSTIGSCLSLEYLYLQGNFFQGHIPSSLSSLKVIQELDFSRNNLSGQIPKDLEYLSFLKKLNISFNDLDGEVPIQGAFQNASTFSIAGNNKLCGGIIELHLHACPIKKSKQKGIPHAFKMIIGVILSSVVVASFLILYWRRKSRSKSSSTLFEGKWCINISYNELHKATGGFASTNLIGMGNFGSVYKGVHKDGSILAVKVLNLIKKGASKSFVTECKAMRNLRHRNLLNIVTICSSVDFKGNDFKALIFKFMPNGSLENWLHPGFDEHHQSRNLNFYQRLNIAIDVASALDYLHNHCQTPIAHCDLKSSNVLLDSDMTAIVGDFGLAKFLATSIDNFEKNDTSSIFIKGTIGYIPPEYGVGAEVSTPGDMYSFGILLLEMFIGKRPTDTMFKDGLSLHHFCKMAMNNKRLMGIVDPHLLLEEEHDKSKDDCENQRCNMMDKKRECLTSIIKIGVACSMECPGERMDINDVLMELHTSKEVFLGVRIHG